MNMKRVKSILGHLWAASTVLIVLASYAGNGFFSRQLAAATDIKVSPRFTGGEVVKTIAHDSYHASVHRPVFDGLLGPRSDGFVQIDWRPAAKLPPMLQEKIDVDGDGREDFLIVLDTVKQTAAVSPDIAGVGTAGQAFKLKDGWAVRIPLNQSRP
jgi:hypothetical protein